MKRGVLRFVSMLFLIFEKKNEQKNCARNFKIRKYAFFNIWESDEQKNCAKNFKIRKYSFLIFEKRWAKKLCSEF